MHHRPCPERRQLLALVIASLALLSCGAFEPPPPGRTLLIEYPIAHYRITTAGLDFVEWKREVRALRSELRGSFPFEDEQPALRGNPRELEFLDRAVDPAFIIWRDPAAFWREPATLSWWELIDESGDVVMVYVVTSNQTPDRDARIISWCLENKAWEPAVIEGRAVASLRTASINLGESRWHIGHWQKRVSGEMIVVFVVLAIALVAYGVVLCVRRWRLGRLESL